MYHVRNYKETVQKNLFQFYMQKFFQIKEKIFTLQF